MSCHASTHEYILALGMTGGGQVLTLSSSRVSTFHAVSKFVYVVDVEQSICWHTVGSLRTIGSPCLYSIPLSSTLDLFPDRRLYFA